MRIALVILLFFTLLWIVACQSNQPTSSNEIIRFKYPSYIPKISIPEDNQPTLARIELGRRLFYDKRLSKNETQNCASCHSLSSAFTDGKTVSLGAHGKPGKRNAPTLANLAWSKSFMAEGGVPSLEMQVLAPIQDSIEMDMPLPEAAERLRKDAHLNALSLSAYNREIDEYVIVRAIACFERSFISFDTRFDRWYYLKDETAFSDSEKNGKGIFFSDKASCNKCHTLPFFTDGDFYNVGLYESYPDAGRQRVSHLDADNGKFKTPTLRNIELTAPYMHDGSLATLEEVIELYNKGGEVHPNKDFRIQPLELTDQQKRDLLAFLKTLTDWNFVQNHTLLPLEQ